MPITHVNRRGKTYYLHIGKTKTGKEKYFFSLKSNGTLAETIPDGYEVYENPDARVYIRIIQPKLITDIEKAMVDKGMRQYLTVKNYQIDIKKDIITIYTADQSGGGLSDALHSIFLATDRSKEFIDNIVEQYLTYTPMLRFILIDEEKREFVAERYCFRGSIDDWIEIGGPDTLEKLVKKFAKHLGKDSFYDLPLM